MVNIKTFKAIALSFPDAVELPHFEKTSFRINKKIFLTLSVEKHVAVVKLSEIDQSVFCAFDKSVIHPVENKWGKQGWTVIHLKRVRKKMLEDILACAYSEIALKKRATKKG